jgi:hypothetical protein
VFLVVFLATVLLTGAAGLAKGLSLPTKKETSHHAERT